MIRFLGRAGTDVASDGAPPASDFRCMTGRRFAFGAGNVIGRRFGPDHADWLNAFALHDPGRASAGLRGLARQAMMKTLGCVLAGCKRNSVA